MSKQELEKAVANAKVALANAELALVEWSGRAENNVFATMDDAMLAIEGALTDMAHADCQGAYNCGAEAYSREFMVDGKTYVGTLALEYNRHDKTYYYIDGSDFTVAEKVAS